MAIAFAAMAALALAYVAPAQAHRLRPGVRSAAPSDRALSAALEKTTGLSMSQVTAKNICSAARPGYARCGAQALVLRSNHALVRPHVARQATFGRVKPAFALGSLLPVVAPASAPPSPGTPAYLQQAYDLSYLSQTRGTGDTVAIVDPFDDPTAEADVGIYRSQFGLPSCTTANGCFRKINQQGNASPLPAQNSAWEQEMSLDLDAVSALCPHCNILLVEAASANSADLSAAMQTAASKGANQISASWTIAITNGILSGAYVFKGVSTVAANGDTGYLGTSSDNFPAAFSKVTAAGGTTLAPTGGARGFSEGAWSLSGGQEASSGCASQVTKPSYQTDTGCSKRAYADVSADADPATGLSFYDSQNAGTHWGVLGGTSLASALIAAYYAITGVDGTSPQWAYTNSALLNDPTSGSNGTCAQNIRYICNAGPGYDGPTGVGSISGAVVTGAPGIGGPPVNVGNSTTYTQSTRSRGVTLTGGIYPNRSDTRWWIEYGTDSTYGQQTPSNDIGSGTPPVSVTGYLSHLAPNGTYHYRLVAQNGLGTTYGYDYSFTTPASTPTDPTASLAPPAAVTPNSQASFDASSSIDSVDSITDYSWDFGDGSTFDSGPSASTTHRYASPGVYNVTLIVTDSRGQSDSTSQTITIDTPTAAFVGPQTVPAPGSLATFDASASTDPLATITNYSWDFGDGMTDRGSSPGTTHTYANRGTYTVTLTITNSLGQTATQTHPVTIDTAPTAMLNSPAGIQATNTPVSFDGRASTPATGGTITDYKWSFGDGTPTDDTHGTATDSHSYAAPGVYTVRLTVTDELGVSNTSSHTVTVDHPTAAFASPPAPLPGSRATFDASRSTDPQGTITDYSWVFGDGRTFDAGSGTTTTHTYASRGTYHVVLTVTNNSRQTDQTSRDVTVDNPPTASLTPSAPVATPGSPLSFNGSASTPGAGGTIKSYSWNFGDGNTGNGATASHTYANPGQYTVSLAVTDDLGITNTTTQRVTIDQPTAAFTPPSTTPAPKSPASFDATGSTDSAGTITDYSWKFGDGSGTLDAGAGPTTTHTYASRGLYHVTLTVTNNSGQTAQIEHDVTIDTPPTAAFSPPAGAQAANSQAGFNAGASTAAPSGSIASYRWDFGDGGTGSGVSPSHSYANPGHYTASLTVTDELGLTDTTTRTVTVDAAPVASISAFPNPASVGPAIGFDGRGSSDSIGTITSYSWDFGDGASGSGAAPTHAYGTPGHYAVSLTVTNDAGQTASTSHAITVDAAPVALFSVAPTAARTGAPVAFNASSSSDAVGAITACSWSFGDGGRANGASTSHVYGSPGTYTVALTVTNDAGQSTTSSQTVTVYAAPSASFAIAAGSAHPAAAVSFNASSSRDAGGAITGYSWSFGDGGTGSGPSPSHAYANPGTYTVTLIVTGSLGLATSTSHTVTINPYPLSVRLSSSKRRTLAAVLKHGLRISVSTNTRAKATLIVTMPVHASKHGRHGSRRKRLTVLARPAPRGVGAGVDAITLKLSHAAAAKLRAAGRPVLTIQMILTDVYGRKATRSVKVTVTG